MDSGKMPRGKCAICGVEIPVPNIRDKKAHYCSRAHAALARYSGRYRGTNAGPLDRPNNLLDKTKDF